MNTAIVGLFSMAMGVYFIIIAWYVLTLVAINLTQILG